VCARDAATATAVTSKVVTSNSTKQNGHSTPSKHGDDAPMAEDVPMADAVGDAASSPGRRSRQPRAPQSASRTTDEETDSRTPPTRASARLRSSRKWVDQNLSKQKTFNECVFRVKKFFLPTIFCHFSLPTDNIWYKRLRYKRNKLFPFFLIYGENIYQKRLV
jgi:hypothetical protein